jgi:hypothetical protein
MDRRALPPLVAALLLLLALLGYSIYLFLKPYGKSGGYVGLPISRVCGCAGLRYSYHPPGCQDCATEYYCFGALGDCKCFSEDKALELAKKHPEGYKNVNRDYGTYQELLDNAYLPCS